MSARATIPFVDVTGQPREYPQSFDERTLERLAGVVLSREHATMIEVVQSSQNGGAITGHTVVRHDVDHSIDHALDFARWEASLGIRSTYFVLHTAWYWRDFEETASKCRELQRLGHEVGIHHDSLTAAKIYGGSASVGKIAEYVLKTALMRLHGAGVHVRGCAAHGGAYPNLDVWKTWSLSQFGLEYEAYHVHGELHANYVSDNRGELRAPLEHVEGRPTHLLVHPEHWQVPKVRVHA